MPDTEACPRSTENTATIKASKEAFEDFRTEVRVDIKSIQASVTRLTNHYSARPQWWVVLIASALVGTISTLATYIVMVK